MRGLELVADTRTGAELALGRQAERHGRRQVTEDLEPAPRVGRIAAVAALVHPVEVPAALGQRELAEDDDRVADAVRTNVAFEASAETALDEPARRRAVRLAGQHVHRTRVELAVLRGRRSEPEGAETVSGGVVDVQVARRVLLAGEHLVLEAGNVGRAGDGDRGQTQRDHRDQDTALRELHGHLLGFTTLTA